MTWSAGVATASSIVRRDGPYTAVQIGPASCCLRPTRSMTSSTNFRSCTPAVSRTTGSRCLRLSHGDSRSAARVRARSDRERRCRADHADPLERVLTVYRWQEAGYLVVLSAAAGTTVRAEPFEISELRVGALFGVEDDDE
jgi:hypothetical protein